MSVTVNEYDDFVQARTLTHDPETPKNIWWVLGVLSGKRKMYLKQDRLLNRFI